MKCRHKCWWFAAQQTGTQLSRSVNQKTGFYTWVSFLIGLMCVIAESCSGLKWEVIWRKEKTGLPKAFNGSSQFRFIWAAALLGLTELLSRQFEMHRVRLIFFFFFNFVAVFHYTVLVQLCHVWRNWSRWKIAFQLNQLSDTVHSMALQAALLAQLRIYWQSKNECQVKFCLSCVPLMWDKHWLTCQLGLRYLPSVSFSAWVRKCAGSGTILDSPTAVMRFHWTIYWRNSGL